MWEMIGCSFRSREVVRSLELAEVSAYALWIRIRIGNGQNGYLRERLPNVCFRRQSGHSLATDSADPHGLGATELLFAAFLLTTRTARLFGTGAFLLGRVCAAVSRAWTSDLPRTIFFEGFGLFGSRRLGVWRF